MRRIFVTLCISILLVFFIGLGFLAFSSLVWVLGVAYALVSDTAWELATLPEAAVNYVAVLLIFTLIYFTARK